MVTGDSVETARAIASECGILSPAGLVMEGQQLRAVAPEDLPSTLEQLQVRGGLGVLGDR